MTLPTPGFRHSSEECLDHLENNYANTNIVLPDGRELWEANGELYVLINYETVEKYAPVTDFPWEEKLSRIRQVKEDQQAMMIEGVLVDTYSASAILVVYDNLSLKNKLMLLSKSIPQMASIAFKVLERSY